MRHLGVTSCIPTYLGYSRCNIQRFFAPLLQPHWYVICPMEYSHSIPVEPPFQWEFQDPKIEVLYRMRQYFVGIFPYIVLKNRPYMVGTSNQSVPVAWPLTISHQSSLITMINHDSPIVTIVFHNFA
jgi:hypothetical protein